MQQYFPGCRTLQKVWSPLGAIAVLFPVKDRLLVRLQSVNSIYLDFIVYKYNIILWRASFWYTLAEHTALRVAAVTTQHTSIATCWQTMCWFTVVLDIFTTRQCLFILIEHIYLYCLYSIHNIFTFVTMPHCTSYTSAHKIKCHKAALTFTISFLLQSTIWTCSLNTHWGWIETF